MDRRFTLAVGTCTWLWAFPCLGQQELGSSVVITAAVAAPSQNADPKPDGSSPAGVDYFSKMPTDDFGHELNYCLVPWDFVPLGVSAEMQPNEPAAH